MDICSILFIFTILAVSCKTIFTENLNLLILHNNDMRSRFEEVSALAKPCQDKTTGCYGGFARTAHVIRQARKKAKEGKGPEVLYLNAGDTYGGTVWFNGHKGKIVADFLNLLQPDAVSLGNHEFDLKIKGILPFLNQARFPIVSANLDYSKEPRLKIGKITKSVVLEVSGKKIGVIGYLTPQTSIISSPGNITFGNEIAAVKKESELLDKQGVKIIIALGHSGFEVDKMIAEQVPLVDLVVGGHSKKLLWNGPKPDLEQPVGSYPFIVQQHSGKKVPVVHSFGYTKYMGRLNIVFNDEGEVIKYDGQPLLLDDSIPQEKDLLDLLEVYRTKVKDLEQEVVGESLVTLDGYNCGHQECNIANFVADAFVDYVSSLYGGDYWTDAPIAIINAGSIRDSIWRGKVTRADLLRALPYEDTIYTMNINGSHLLETLEFGVRENEDEIRKELIQTSGIQYLARYENLPGQRIEEAYVRCGFCDVPRYEPLKRDLVYKIITTGYLSAGGDGHTVIAEKGYNMIDLDVSIIEVISRYLYKISPVYPAEDRRVSFIFSSESNGLKIIPLFALVGVTLGLLVVLNLLNLQF